MKNTKINKIVGYTMTTLSFAFLAMILVSPAKANTHNQKALKDIDYCKMLTVAFFENGMMDEGGVERLYINLPLAEQKSQAKKWVNETGTSEVINFKGDCTVNIKFNK